jgi:hypothetical protein
MTRKGAISMFIFDIILGFVIVWIMFFIWGMLVTAHDKAGKRVAIIFVVFIIVATVILIFYNGMEMNGIRLGGPIGGFVGGVTSFVPRRAGKRIMHWAKGDDDGNEDIHKEE